jgi:hypothetical protein
MIKEFPMVGLTSAETYATRIKDAIKSSNWEGLERALDRLKQIFLDSIVFGDRDVATFIGKSVAEARTELLLSARLRPARNAEAMSWVLASDSATCMAGLRMFRPDGDANKPVAENVEEQVLKLLFDDREPISTGDIAERVCCARETASRALSALRDKAFVRTVPVGRTRLHYITRRGQLRLLGEQAGQSSVPDLAIKPDIPKDILRDFNQLLVEHTSPPRQMAQVPRAWVRNEPRLSVEALLDYRNDPCADSQVYLTAGKVPAAAAIMDR